MLTALSVLVVIVGGDFLVHTADPPAHATRGVPSVTTAVPIAMDNMLPFAGLSVAKQWTADPTNLVETLWLTLFVLLKLVGWGMAALGLASVTGIVKKP